jgi:hypothetical protein
MFIMRNNFYLKLVVALFVATPCFADGVDTIRVEDSLRCPAFNANPFDVSGYAPRTAKINVILKEERNVVDRPAKTHEKETILKAVMASVVIHGFDINQTSVFKKTLDINTALGQHFEILRLTEALAGGLMGQLDAGFMDIAALTGYENLYGFSGMGVDAYENWFRDVVNQHSPGLMIKKIDCLSADVKSFTPQKVHELNEMIEFGTIEKKSITRQSVVFVSTYNLNAYQPISNGLFIHLPTRGGREKYIVIENPFFDDSITDGSRSPYTIRAHALVNGDAQPRNVNVNIAITSGLNKESEVGITNLQGGSVNSHDNTFSPNNMHLTGLPDRSLIKGEVFSFVSKIDGDGKRIDTLHVVAYDANSVVNLAKDSENLGDFLQRLSRAYEIFGADTLSHLAKMMAFIEGTI